MNGCEELKKLASQPMKCKVLLNRSHLVIWDWQHGNKVTEHTIDEK